MKTYNTYYDSELDSLVIDNLDVEQGEFTEDTKVVTVESIKQFLLENRTTKFAELFELLEKKLDGEK